VRQNVWRHILNAWPSLKAAHPIESHNEKDPQRGSFLLKEIPKDILSGYTVLGHIFREEQNTTDS
jgi:hypothetical protein